MGESTGAEEDREDSYHPKDIQHGPLTRSGPYPIRRITLMYLLPHDFHSRSFRKLQQIGKSMEVHEGIGPVRIQRDGRSTKIECWRPMVAPDGQPVGGFDCINFGEVNKRLATQVVSWPLAKWRIENNGQYVTFNLGVAMYQDGEVFDPDA